MGRILLGIAVGLAACGGAPAPEPSSPYEESSRTEAPENGEKPVTVIAVAPPEEPPTPPEEPAPSEVALSGPTGSGTFHADSARTGATAASPIDRPRILWKSSVGIASWLNSPLALRASVVIMPSSGTAHNKPDPGDGVFALDFRTGKRIWHAHFAQDANGVVASESRVFATSDDGSVHALELRTGKEVWKQSGEGKMYTHPLLLDGRVIVGDAGGWVRAYAASDGKEAWKLQLTGAIRGGASTDGASVYVASQGGEVAAIDPRTGKERWRKLVKRPPWNNRGPEEPLEVYSPPVVDKDVLYLPFARDTYYTDQPAILSLDKKTGNVKWRAKGPGEWGNVRSTPVLVAGKLVWGEPYSGDVVAVSAASGRMAYRETIGPCFFPQWSSPVAAGSTVYLPRFDGSVYALDASSGKVRWELYLGDSTATGSRPPAPPSKYGCDWDVPSGHPIYAPAAVAEDGTLFVATGEGVLFAIGK